MTLRVIKGIGPKTEELFHRICVYTPEDLIRYYPVSYDAFEDTEAIASLTAGSKAAVEGVITSAVVMRRFQKVQILTTQIADPTGTLRVNCETGFAAEPFST